MMESLGSSSEEGYSDGSSQLSTNDEPPSRTMCHES